MKNFRKAQFAKNARSGEEAAFLKTICPEYTDRPKLKHMQSVLRWLYSNPQAVQALRVPLSKLCGVSALHTLCLLHYALKEGATAPVFEVLDLLKCPADYHFKVKSYQAFAKNYLAYLWACTEAAHTSRLLLAAPGQFVDVASNAGTQLEALTHILAKLHTVLISGSSCLSENKTQLAQQICHFLVTDLAAFTNLFDQLAGVVKTDLLNFSLQEATAAHKSLATISHWATVFAIALAELKERGVHTPTLQWTEDSSKDQAWREGVIHQLTRAGEVDEALEVNRQKKLEETEQLRQQEHENIAILDCLVDLQFDQPTSAKPTHQELPAPERFFRELPLTNVPEHVPQMPAMNLFPGQMCFYPGQLGGQMPYPSMPFMTGSVPSMQQTPSMQSNLPMQPGSQPVSSNPFDSLI